ncbi:MAG TPA: hypothetical protein VFE62_01880 [Gemmataceae bacterium]|nr:hypothetical protein [Gemmataceae bacterium]
MDIPRHLRDVYRFPGLVPTASVQRHASDAGAIIVPLRRRRKKQSAAIVGNPIDAATTNIRVGFAIFLVATNASTF